MGKRTFYERFLKRGLDVVFALLLLVILAPLFLLIAILSQIFIHGHVIFTQLRPGRHGKVFKVYKFKSMTMRTDSQGNLLPDAARITRFGKFLRWSSLDELPQLWNILAGQMSFVGPRPRAVSDMVFYTPEQLQICRIRPGLTGLAQVTGGRSRADWAHIFQSDLAYQAKITLWRDIKVVVKTIFVVLFHSDGAVSGAAQTQREYYYADYLLKHNYITRQQYLAGAARAKAIIVTHGTVTYDAALQPQGECYDH